MIDLALGKHGTLTNLGASDWGTDVEMLHALNFSGSTAAVEHVLFPFIQPPKPRTVCAWISVIADADNKEVLGWVESGVSGGHTDEFRVTPAEKLEYGSWNGTSFGSVTGGTTLTSAWTHVAMTRAANDDVELFINGVSEATGSVSEAPTNLNNYLIGGSLTDVMKEPFNGRIAYLDVNNVVLPAAVINQKASPQHRWNIFYELGRVFYSVPAAAAVGNPWHVYANQ